MKAFVSKRKESSKSPDPSLASIALAAVIVLFAAFLMCSIIWAAISFDIDGHSGLAAPGYFLYSAYGLTSFLVPAFLLTCAISLLLQAASFPLCFLLLTSVIPFFTAFGGEKLIRALSVVSGSAFLSRLIFFGLLISTALAMTTEYLLLYQLALYAEKKYKERKSGSSIKEKERPKEKADLGKEPEAQPESENVEYSEGEFLSPHHAEESAERKSEEEAARKQEDLAEAKGALAHSESLEAASSFESKDSEEAALASDSESEDEAAFAAESEDVAAFSAEEDAGEEAVAFDAEGEGTVVFDADAVAFAAESEDEVVFVDESEDVAAFSAEEDAGEEAVAFDAEGEDTMVFDADVAAFAAESEDVAPFNAEKDTAKEVDNGLSDVEFDPAMFEGYIAGHFSVTESGEAGEALPPPPSESAPSPVALPVAMPSRRKYHIDCDILNAYPDGEYWVIDEDTHKAATALKETLNEFNIQAEVTGIRKGPVITMIEILPAPGVKLSKIVGLQDNIALRLAASSVRIVAPIPGKHAVGIEVPNQKRAIVSFRELIEADSPASKKMGIPVMLGKDITGEAQIVDLTMQPHLLIAGSTGSGKSVCVNSIILSILYKRAPDEVRLILIDPKVVELKLYNDIGHLLSPVITEPKKAFQALQYCLCEMERRYAVLDGMGVRNIKEYNKRILERGIAAEKLPYIVVIIDEFADLMATTGKELESTVARLAAMSRAVGIHLVLATQRPSIDVITGLIKANIPSRIAFMVASKTDSRIIIDQVGAEKLLGKGDMLYSSVTDPFPVRIQGAFVSDEEVERVVEQVKSFGEPEYIDDEIFVDDDDDDALDTSFFGEGEDPLYEKALDIVLSAGKASASYIQRRLKIGYNRAARLVEDMEKRGIVGPANGSKPREVIHVPDRTA